MAGPQATPTFPTTSGVANLFSTIDAGDISADTVSSVISDLGLFRSGCRGGSSLPHWDSPQTTPTTSHTSPLGMEPGDPPTTSSSVGERALHSKPGPSSEHFSSGHLPAEISNHASPLSDSDQEMPARKKRAAVPSDKKDDRYWERRKKNNIAAKRSRELRRKKTDEELKQAQEAIQENHKLKQEIEVLKAEINSLRRLLKDANMTLSLWIRAKQTAEPNTQLPPMLRGPNVPFVNFPVSSTV